MWEWWVGRFWWGRGGWLVALTTVGIGLAVGRCDVAADESGDGGDPSTRLPEGFVAVRWGTSPALNVVVEKADDGQVPVVLLPGWPQTWLAWRHVAPELADRFHVVVVDPPGIVRVSVTVARNENVSPLSVSSGITTSSVVTCSPRSSVTPE